MKILIFIEHDIIIRHFIHSGVFAALSKKHDVKYIFPEKGHKRIQSDIEALNLDTPYLHLQTNSRRQELWKRLYIADRLYFRIGKQFRTLRHVHRKAIGPKANLIYTFLSLPGMFQLLRRWVMRQLAKTPYDALEKLLDHELPDLILHPSILHGLFISDLVEVSLKRNIPFAVIMNSWDNPSTKKAMVGQPDYLLVWGEQTKRHAIKFMKTPEDRVIKFGAAQFDIYRTPSSMTRVEFCKRHDIDLDAKIVLYAGSSKETDEFQHLVDIDHAIGAKSLGKTIIVYRPHPWGGGGRDGGRFLDHDWKHVRIEETMRAYLEQVRDGTHTMSLPEYRHTHDVLSNIDALVSPLSTIIIEGALHQKPVLCFLPEEESDADHFQQAAPLVHFEDMYRMEEFLVAKGQDELLPKLQKLIALTDDDEFKERLTEACSFFVEPHEKSYGARLVDFVEDVHASWSPKPNVSEKP